MLLSVVTFCFAAYKLRGRTQAHCTTNGTDLDVQCLKSDPVMKINSGISFLDSLFYVMPPVEAVESEL